VRESSHRLVVDGAGSVVRGAVVGPVVVVGGKVVAVVVAAAAVAGPVVDVEVESAPAKVLTTAAVLSPSSSLVKITAVAINPRRGPRSRSPSPCRRSCGRTVTGTSRTSRQQLTQRPHGPQDARLRVADDGATVGRFH
jgi:hypothetical protein